MYCIEQRFAKFSKIVGYRNVDQLNRMMSPFSVKVKLDECMDLPPVQGGLLSPHGPLTIRVEMLEEQARVYRQLKKHFIAGLQKGGIITAPEVTTRLIRLQQLTGGIIQPDGEGTPYEMVPSAKTKAVIDLVEGAEGQKIIIWCRFKPEVLAVTAALQEAGIQALAHSGEDSAAVRSAIREQWQQQATEQVLVSTLSTGGTGFTLNEATVAIFYWNWWAYDDRLQAERRNLRIGQGRPVVYYDVICKGTVDEYVLATLLRKQSVSNLINLNPAAVLTDLMTLTEAA